MKCWPIEGVLRHLNQACTVRLKPNWSDSPFSKVSHRQSSPSSSACSADMLLRHHLAPNVVWSMLSRKNHPSPLTGPCSIQEASIWQIGIQGSPGSLPGPLWDWREFSTDGIPDDRTHLVTRRSILLPLDGTS